VRETDQSPPPSAEVKNAWNCSSTPPMSLHGVMLNWLQDPCSRRGTCLSTGTALPYLLTL